MQLSTLNVSLVAGCTRTLPSQLSAKSSDWSEPQSWSLSSQSFFGAECARLCVRRIASACCLALACAVPKDVSATVASEYQLKAVFLFNFTQFVDWPTEAFPDSSSPVALDNTSLPILVMGTP